MTKSEQAMADTIQILLAAGFKPDGQTRIEHVRVPTKESPILGGTGGVIASFGGRERYTKEGTDIRATVGLRTTSIYRSEGSGKNSVRGIAALPTSDHAGLRKVLSEL